MKTVKLNQLCTIKGGIPAPKKTTTMGNVPFVRMRELGDAHLSSTFSPGKEFLTEADEKTFTDKFIEPGAVLFPRSGSVHLNHRAHLDSKAAIVSHIGALIPKHETDSLFLYHLLTDYDMTEIMTQTTGLNMIRFSQLADVEFQIPDTLPEQTKIAEILSTVDRAIEQTEALIAKQQRIKTGLMQDLLTRGIDEHGNLRSEQTHEFKDSPLGRIPVEWGVKNLKECYAEPARNGLYKPKEFYGSGQKMVHMPQMFRGLVVEVQSAVRVDVDRSEIDRFGLKTHDLLIARRSLVLEGAGRCSLIPEINEPTTFESSIIRVRLKLNELNAKYANFFFNSEAGYRMRLPFIRQVAVSGVSGQDVGEFVLPVPHHEEQNRIVELLNQSDNLVKEITLTAQKLRREKTALMQDLLTGKKRVTMLLNKEVIG